VTYRFLAEARTEFDDAVDWHEAQQPGLGDDFLTEVYSAIQRVVASSHAFPAVSRAPTGREVRVVTVHRFQYLMYYEVTPTEVVILCISHGKRMSHPWRQRLP
jgi:plasmid stabilization system protein ParE